MSRPDQLLLAFVTWYRETEARAKAHPTSWYRAPAEIRRQVGEMMRTLYPDELPCPCQYCVDARARRADSSTTKNPS